MTVMGGGHQARARRRVGLQNPELIKVYPEVMRPACWVYAMGHLQIVDEFEVIPNPNNTFSYGH